MLHTENLEYTVGSSRILRDVSFSVASGEFISVLGPNGSGKTTLLRCLLGLLPFRGKVILDEKKITQYSRKEIGRLIGYVPQIIGALPEFSVEQLVEMGRYAHRGTLFGGNEGDQRAVAKALKSTDTYNLRHREVASLSGGERQRVLLAAAIAQESDLILLDEPSAFLDPQHEIELYRVLRELHTAHGKTLIVVSHDINRSALASQRIVALREGEICFDGTPNAFMNAEVLRNVYQTEFSLVEHPSAKTCVALTQAE